MVSFSSAYTSVSSTGTANKLYVPVNKSSLIYSHFDHVSGVAVKKGQQGVSISKIQILNTLIDNLSSIKSATSFALFRASSKLSIITAPLIIYIILTYLCLIIKLDKFLH